MTIKILVRIAIIERALTICAIGFIIWTSLEAPRSYADRPMGAQLSLSTGFKRDAVYPTTTREGLPADVPVYGSWIGSDKSTGSLKSPWYSAVPRIAIYVAGYPANEGIALAIELREAGKIVRMPVSTTNAGERWIRVVLSMPRTGGDFRIVAADRSTAIQGWLGFSLPCIPNDGVVPTLEQLGRITGCSALVLSALFLPGLLLAGRFKIFSDGSFLFIPGLAGLVLGGILFWTCSVGGYGARIYSAIALALLAFALYAGRKRALMARLDLTTRRVLVICAALFSIAVARSFYAPGPAGELYGETISRTFEPGDRSDSRINYHVVQIAMMHESPYGSTAAGLLAPWSFSSRGPIAGLAAIPIVAVAGGHPLGTLPNSPWLPFDAQGFEAYRIAMFAFASSVVISFFGVIRRAAGTRAAVFAVAIAALAPFTIHETFFTWPKLLSTALVCTATSFVIMQRTLIAGFVLGIAYLVHPSVLFAMVAFASSQFLIVEKKRAFSGLVLMSAGLAVVLLFWRLFNGSHYVQGSFLLFFFDTGHYAPTLGGWLRSRFDSLMNTLVPFWLVIGHSTDISINRLGGLSSVWVHFLFSYWTTLPFGIGLLYCLMFVKRLWDGARQHTGWFLGVLAWPLLLFTIYWGGAPTGMMREGLHWWFFALIGFVAVTMKASINNDIPWLLARVIEVWFVTFILVILDGGITLTVGHAVTDSCALVAVLSASSLLVLTARSLLRDVHEPNVTL